MNGPEPKQEPNKALQIAKRYSDAARERYEKEAAAQYFHAIVCGLKGAGKTQLITTMPAPVYVFSFDPSGSQLPAMREAIKSGRVIVDTRFENDSIADPKAYILFEQTINEMGRTGAFQYFKSVALDSLTTYGNSAIWQVMKKEGRTPPGMSARMAEDKGMRIQDWGTLLNVFVMLARTFGTLPCHTLITAHISRDKDEVLGTFVNTIALPGQGREQVPINISELYVLLEKNTPKGKERVLLTESDAKYRASTRIGGSGVFAAEEKPDITYLLKKAGLPWEDGELLV